MRMVLLLVCACLALAAGCQQGEMMRAADGPNKPPAFYGCDLNTSKDRNLP